LQAVNNLPRREDLGQFHKHLPTICPHSRDHDNIGKLKAGGAKVVDQHLVMDDRIISCDGPGSALEVAFLLMECLLGHEMTREVRRYMMYSNP